jgi:hypothetical protein
MVSLKLHVVNVKLIETVKVKVKLCLCLTKHHTMKTNVEWYL